MGKKKPCEVAVKSSSFILLSLVIIWMLQPLRQGFCENVSFRAGFEYHWWESTKREKGNESFMPVCLNVDWHDFQFRVLTGYLYAYRDMQGEDSHSTDDILDTKLNLSYFLNNLLGFDLLMGVDFNLPTGRTNLSSKDIDVVADPDLVPVTSWGEGFNVNPTLIVARSWDKVLVGVGAGFLWRDSYDYGNEFDDYDPGDIWRLTGEVRVYPSDSWTLRTFSSYTWYGEDKVRDNDFYQPGDMFELGFGMVFKKFPWMAKCTFASYFREKDEILNASGKMVSEDKNSYGDEFVLDSYLQYRLSKKHAIFGVLNLLQVEPNGYQKGEEFYRGRRQKAEAGVGWRWKFYKNYQLSTLGTLFLLHDNEMPDHPYDNRTYRGASIRLTLTTRF